MIDQKYPTEVGAFEDAVEATTFIASVHVREGELMLPKRIREHIADGPVVVHLLRGEDDVAVHPATLTSRSTLTGIEWPEDIKPRMTLTVMCPRGAAGHDVGVVLPALAEPLHYEYAEDDREAALVIDDVAELIEAAKSGVGWSSDRREPDVDVDPIDLVETSATGELDIDEAVLDPWDEAAHWPGDEDVTAQEVTDLLPVVMPIVVEQPAEPGTVYSAALVAAKTRRRWFSPLVDVVATTVRLSARWELEHSRTVARLILGGLSLAVLAGVGVLFTLGVTR